MTAPPSSGISSSGSPTRLLLLDTSGPEASLALAEAPASGTDPHIVATDTFPGRQASELLLVRLERLLKRAGWTSHSISAMAVVTGPGSFTGVRIGLAAAKGLAEACQVQSSASPVCTCSQPLLEPKQFQTRPFQTSPAQPSPNPSSPPSALAAARSSSAAPRPTPSTTPPLRKISSPSPRHTDA